ncbi:MAG TPA: DUF488 family protein [Steroidobacteraceae bacterium]|nr:DUF488 family protein [Steroidobacteraceae bacterium]
MKMTAHSRHRPSVRAKSRIRRKPFDSSVRRTQKLDTRAAPTGGPDVRIKRIYDKPERSDGARVLVDRVWPRGVTKHDAALDDWLRELAPSSRLRRWFGHDPRRWSEFRIRYHAELRQHAPRLDALRRRAAQERVTLLYGAKDTQMNQAVVLQEAIRKR